MASTRNINTPGNYCLDQKQYRKTEDWRLYLNGANGYAYDTKLAGQGLIQQHMPAKTLSHNSTEIESFLLGINSTNLVNPAGPLSSELKCLQSCDIYKTPRVIMPKPLVVPKDQRPFPVPS